MRVDIYIGGTKLDLFSDESIDVVSSVADIEDITKNTTDYTKTFTVPASKSATADCGKPPLGAGLLRRVPENTRAV